MNILYIFVEIIKKSTTMKNLILTVTFLFVNVLLFGQSPYQFKSSLDSNVTHTYVTSKNAKESLKKLNIPYLSLPDRYLNVVDDSQHTKFFGDSFSKLPNDNVIMTPYNNIIGELSFRNPDSLFWYDVFMSSAEITEFKLLNVDDENVTNVLIVEYFYKSGDNQNGLFSTVVFVREKDGFWDYAK